MRSTILKVGLLLATASAVAFGQPGRLAPDLPTQGGEKVDVIIQFNDPPGQGDFASVNGGELKRKLPAIDGALFSIPANALKGLAHNPRIKYVSPDREVGALLDYAHPSVGADIARSYGWDGSGVGVAIIDSGIDTHKDFGYSNGSGPQRIDYSENFVSANVDDEYGHGSHVAGVLAGNGSHSDGVFMGVAPATRLINLRALDQDGLGTDSTVIAAINRAIELKNQYNIRIINLSLGRAVAESFQFDPLCQAVEAAWNAGIVVVAAAGNMGRDNSFENEGYGTIASPGNDPYVITVGAMKTVYTPSRSDDEIQLQFKGTDSD